MYFPRHILINPLLSLSRYDLVREGVVVFLGTLARHLPPEDPKRSAIVQTLLDVLGTPSESVQRSVSTCLAPLIQVWTWVWGDCELPGGVLDKNVRCMRGGVKMTLQMHAWGLLNATSSRTSSQCMLVHTYMCVHPSDPFAPVDPP